MSFHYKEWYESGFADSRNEDRRRRYAEDPEYRERVLERNREYKRKRRKEKANRRARVLTKASRDVWRVGPDRRIGISAMARALGCSVSALRKWERDGVIPPAPERDGRGHRRYTRDTIEEYYSILTAEGRIASVHAKMTPSAVLAPVERAVRYADGSVEILPLFRLGTLASVIGRTTVAVTQLEKKGYLPPTPLRSVSARRDRYYTLEMVEAVFEVLRDHAAVSRSIKGDVWRGIRTAIEERWGALGMVGSAIEARAVAEEGGKKG